MFLSLAVLGTLQQMNLAHICPVVHQTGLGPCSVAVFPENCMFIVSLKVRIGVEQVFV